VAASPTTDSDTRRFLLFASVLELVATISRRQTVVLVFDDLQWADAASLQLLRHLITVGHPMRVLVVAAFREGGRMHSGALLEFLGSAEVQRVVHRVELSGLTEAGVVAYLESAAGHALDGTGSRLASAIYRETDGNPFFVTEMRRHLIEVGVIVRDETGRWSNAGSLEGSTLPKSVHEVIAERVQRLGGDAGKVLSTAAAIGRDFDIDSLAGATGTPEEHLLDVLDAATAAALIREVDGVPGQYSFAHALIQRTMYEQMSAARRARLHLLVARSLEDLCGDEPGDRAAELARHWSKTARSADLPKAFHYARCAGDVALAGLAPTEALHHYTRAQSIERLLTSLDPRASLDVSIGLGTAQRQTGDPEFRDRLIAAAHRAAELGDTRRMVTAALANDRGLFTRFGRVDTEKVDVLETVLARVSRDDPDRCLLLAILCQELTFGSPVERRMDLADEAITLARASGDDAAIVAVLIHVADPLRVPELLDQSLDRSEEGLTRAQRIGDPILLFWAAVARRVAAACAGDIDELDRCLDLSRELAESLDQPFLTWTQTYATADRLLLAGDLDQAERLVTEAFEIGTGSGEPDAMGLFGAQFVSVSSQRGTMGEILPLIQQAADENPGIPAFVACLAGAHAEGDRPDEAAVFLEKFASQEFVLPMDVGWITGMVTYAEAAIECREPRFALPILRQLAPWRDQLSHNDVTTEGPVSHYLGGLASVLGQFDDSEGYYRQSAELCRRIGAKGFAARTDLSWARMLLARNYEGDVARALHLLLKAREASAANGYGTTLRRASTLLHELSDAEPHRVPATATRPSELNRSSRR
jgi:tetratricopeptide (TPR) repeat protein